MIAYTRKRSVRSHHKRSSPPARTPANRPPSLQAWQGLRTHTTTPLLSPWQQVLLQLRSFRRLFAVSRVFSRAVHARVQPTRAPTSDAQQPLTRFGRGRVVGADKAELTSCPRQRTRNSERGLLGGGGVTGCKVGSPRVVRVGCYEACTIWPRAARPLALSIL